VNQEKNKQVKDQKAEEIEEEELIETEVNFLSSH
jgi:hypothetical protein